MFPLCSFTIYCAHFSSHFSHQHHYALSTHTYPALATFSTSHTVHLLIVSCSNSVVPNRPAFPSPCAHCCTPCCTCISYSLPDDIPTLTHPHCPATPTPCGCCCTSSTDAQTWQLMPQEQRSSLRLDPHLYLIQRKSRCCYCRRSCCYCQQCHATRWIPRLFPRSSTRWCSAAVGELVPGVQRWLPAAFPTHGMPPAETIVTTASSVVST